MFRSVVLKKHLMVVLVGGLVALGVPEVSRGQSGGASAATIIGAGKIGRCKWTQDEKDLFLQAVRRAARDHESAEIRLLTKRQIESQVDPSDLDPRDPSAAERALREAQDYAPTGIGNRYCTGSGANTLYANVRVKRKDADAERDRDRIRHAQEQNRKRWGNDTGDIFGSGPDVPAGRDDSCAKNPQSYTCLYGHEDVIAVNPSKKDPPVTSKWTPTNPKPSTSPNASCPSNSVLSNYYKNLSERYSAQGFNVGPCYARYLQDGDWKSFELCLLVAVESKRLPNLTNGRLEIIGHSDLNYNCYGYALDPRHPRWIGPRELPFPKNKDNADQFKLVTQKIIDLYGSEGWRPTVYEPPGGSLGVPPNEERVIFYVKKSFTNQGIPLWNYQHAVYQNSGGIYSKMGQLGLFKIEKFEQLGGGAYGNPYLVLSRRTY